MFDVWQKCPCQTGARFVLSDSIDHRPMGRNIENVWTGSGVQNNSPDSKDLKDYDENLSLALSDEKLF
jgi:hypothetical protein